MKVVRITLEQDLVAAVDRVSRKSGVSRSAFIRQVLQEAVEGARREPAALEVRLVKRGTLTVGVPRKRVAPLTREVVDQTLDRLRRRGSNGLRRLLKFEGKLRWRGNLDALRGRRH